VNNGESVKQKVPTNPISWMIVCVLFGLVYPMFMVLTNTKNMDPYEPLSTEMDIGLNKILEKGTQNHDHENLLSKIREDLKIPYCLEIKIIVGPYENISGEGRIIYSTNPFALILLLSKSFYLNLTHE